MFRMKGLYDPLSVAFGAVVFQAIEQPAEIAKCDQAKLELKDKIAQFGDEVGF